MKKTIIYISILLFTLSGCKTKRINTTVKAQNSVKDILSQQINSSENNSILPNSVISTTERQLEQINVPSLNEIKNQATLTTQNPSKGLIDLTTMNSTMIYSQVFDMMIMPDEYENTDIKVKGYFQVYNYEGNPDKYLSVVIPDATQCCQQGIEFIFPGKEYPKDFPDIGSQIEVTGRFCMTYTKDNALYTFMQLSELKTLN